MTFFDTTAQVHARPRRSLMSAVRNIAALARQRRRLATLDAHRLDDLGITAQAAQAEANRPIWDVPANWRQ